MQIEKNYTNLQVKKSLLQAIKYLDEYNINCGIYLADMGDYLSYDLCITVWNGDEMITDIYMMTIETETETELDKKDLQPLFKELEKTYKYLSNHFNNIKKFNELIRQ